MAKQHANATTTPEMRVFIRESDLPTAVLARLLKISEATVRKWRKRSSIDDGSTIPKQLNTTLTQAQEYVVVELRQCLMLSLDELLTVSREFINTNVSRAGLQRCLKRHGVSKLADMENSGDYLTAEDPNTISVAIEDTLEHKQLESKLSPDAMLAFLNRANNHSADEVVQVKVTQMPEFEDKSREISSEQENHSHNKSSQAWQARRLLIASDPASGWVYVDIYDGTEKDAAGRYMRYVLNNAPFHIRKILAGNYNEFLSRFRLLNDEVEHDKFSSKSGVSEPDISKSLSLENADKN